MHAPLTPPTPPPHPGVHVEQLQPAHAGAYRALMLEAYELAADAFTSTAEERAAEPESFWIRRMADAAGLALGAFEGSQLVGTVALEFSAKPKTRHKALVIGMYVRPVARGRQVGAALLQAALLAAQRRPGIRMLTLTVTEGNQAAIALYRRFGFEAFGVEPMAILASDGFKGKVHMWRALAADGGPA